MAEEKKGVEGVIETLEEQLQKRERFLEYGSWTSVSSSTWTLKTIRISKEGAYVAETLTVTFRHRTKEDARKSALEILRLCKAAGMPEKDIPGEILRYESPSEDGDKKVLVH